MYIVDVHMKSGKTITIACSRIATPALNPGLGYADHVKLPQGIEEYSYDHPILGKQYVAMSYINWNEMEAFTVIHEVNDNDD